MSISLAISVDQGSHELTVERSRTELHETASMSCADRASHVQRLLWTSEMIQFLKELGHLFFYISCILRQEARSDVNYRCVDETVYVEYWISVDVEDLRYHCGRRSLSLIISLVFMAIAH